jgi:hypothetical protein
MSAVQKQPLQRERPKGPRQLALWLNDALCRVVARSAARVVALTARRHTQ